MTTVIAESQTDIDNITIYLARSFQPIAKPTATELAGLCHVLLNFPTFALTLYFQMDLSRTTS